jgi:hypothetical protein
MGVGERKWGKKRRGETASKKPTKQRNKLGTVFLLVSIIKSG